MCIDWAHSVLRAGATSVRPTPNACDLPAMWRPATSRSTNLPMTAGTTDTDVPVTANDASLGGVSNGASAGPSTTRSFAGSTTSTSREPSTAVDSVGTICCGLTTTGVAPTV